MRYYGDVNGVAHYLFGLLITLMVIQAFSNDQDKNDHTTKMNARIAGIILLLSFFSHMFVDALARFTYHPAESNWGDPIYASWHLATYLAEAVFAIYFLRTDLRYTIGMLGSVGFDLWDWSIARPLEQYTGYDLPGIHFLADMTETFLFSWTPSLRYEQWALIIEVIIVILLFIGWRQAHRNSTLGKKERPGSWNEILGLVLIFGSLRLLTLV